MWAGWGRFGEHNAASCETAEQYGESQKAWVASGTVADGTSESSQQLLPETTAARPAHHQSAGRRTRSAQAGPPQLQRAAESRTHLHSGGNIMLTAGVGRAPSIFNGAVLNWGHNLAYTRFPMQLCAAALACPPTKHVRCSSRAACKQHHSAGSWHQPTMKPSPCCAAAIPATRPPPPTIGGWRGSVVACRGVPALAGGTAAVTIAEEGEQASTLLRSCRGGRGWERPGALRRSKRGQEEAAGKRRRAQWQHTCGWHGTSGTATIRDVPAAPWVAGRVPLAGRVVVLAGSTSTDGPEAFSGSVAPGARPPIRRSRKAAGESAGRVVFRGCVALAGVVLLSGGVPTVGRTRLPPGAVVLAGVSAVGASGAGVGAVVVLGEGVAAAPPPPPPVWNCCSWYTWLPSSEMTATE